MSDQEKPQTIYACPACKSSIAYSSSNAYRPFCSEQCKNKDFIDWANEEHKIAGSSVFDDLMSEEIIADMQEAQKGGLNFDS